MPDQLFDSIAGTNQERYDSRSAFVENEDDDLSEQIRRDLNNAAPKVESWKTQGRKARRYYNDHQWDDIDRMRLEQSKRPAIQFNEIKPTIDAVSGLERLNRQDIRFVSRKLDSSDEEDAEGDLATEAVSTVDDISHGDKERSRAIKDMGIGGMGWIEVKTDYTQDLDGRIIKERIDPFEMRWDTKSKKENLEDSRWRARVRNIGLKEFAKRWPDKVEALGLQPPDYDEQKIEKYELVTPYYSIANERANPQIGQNLAVKHEIELVQYQWRDEEAVYRFIDPQSKNPGQIAELSEDDWRTLKRRMDMLGAQVPKAVRQLKPVYKQAWYARGVVLEDPIALPGFFSLLAITGLYDEDDEVWYGIVRPMLDPQDVVNKSISSKVTVLIANAKGGVIVKTSALADPLKAKEDWAKPDAWIEAHDHANLQQDIYQREPAQIPRDYDQIFLEAQGAISKVSGINEELIGIAQGQTPSTTVQNRLQSGLVVLGWFFDNITRLRRVEARVTLEFIREYWSQGQLIRVGGDYNAKSIPLLAAKLPKDYELALDDSVRHNPNLKAQVWSDLQPIIPSLLRFGFGRFLLKALKFSALPGQLVNELEKEATENPPQGNQKGKGKSEDPQLTQAKVKKFSADSERALAEARALDKESSLNQGALISETMMHAAELKHKQRIDEHRMKMDQIKAAKLSMHGGQQPRHGGPPA